MVDVKSGYKRTEIGVIPEDWDMVRLGDLIEFRNGVNADKDAYGQGVPFINVLEIITKSHLYTSDIPGRVSLSRNLTESFAVRRGDIVFNRTSETQEEVGLASVYLGDDEIVFGGFVIRGRPIRQSMNAIYSGYILRAPIVRTQIIAKGQGAIRANVGQGDLRQVFVPLPPTLAEQYAIANTLGEVDDQITALDDLIAKKRDLKQGTMQRLLTGEERLPGFSGEWKIKKLGEILRYEQPGQYLVQSTDYLDTGTPVLTAGKTFILGHTDEDFGIYHNLPVIVFDDFTVASRYVNFPFKVKSSAIKLLTARAEFTSLWFISELMQILTHPISEHKRYYISEYQYKEVAMPEHDEQHAIATVLSDMDAEIGTLEEKREKTVALKGGMMQELLTGKTRLI